MLLCCGPLGTPLFCIYRGGRRTNTDGRERETRSEPERASERASERARDALRNGGEFTCARVDDSADGERGRRRGVAVVEVVGEAGVPGADVLGMRPRTGRCRRARGGLERE